MGSGISVVTKTASSSKNDLTMVNSMATASSTLNISVSAVFNVIIFATAPGVASLGLRFWFSSFAIVGSNPTQLQWHALNERERERERERVRIDEVERKGESEKKRKNGRISWVEERERETNKILLFF